MKKEKKYLLVGILIGIVLGIVGLFGTVELVQVYRKIYRSSTFTPYNPGIFVPSDDPNYVAHLYPSDPGDNQLLLGASHNVFIGKVLTQTGNKETEIGPRTQYKVQVIDNIKGDLHNTVTVDLLGGTQNGKLITIEGIPPEEYLLTPDTTYVFATRYNTEEDWYTLIAHPNARKVLSTNVTLPIPALKAIANKDAKVLTLRSIYPTEILDNADIANHNTRNSFTSLPPEAKVTAQARAEEARGILEKLQ